MKIKNIYAMLLGAVAAVMMAACSDELPQPAPAPADPADNEWHECPMTLTLGDSDFASRGEAYEFQNGATLLLRLYHGDTFTMGYAKYNTSTNVWKLTYQGELSASTGTNRCDVLFPEKGCDMTNFTGLGKVVLNSNTPLYSTQAGIYNYTGTSVNIVATLKPATARIRFHAPQATELRFKGLDYPGSGYTSFDVKTWICQSYGTAIENSLVIYTRDWSAKPEGGWATDYYYVTLPQDDHNEYLKETFLKLKIDTYVYLLEEYLTDEMVYPGATIEVNLPQGVQPTGWIRESYRYNTYSSYSCSNAYSEWSTDTESRFSVAYTTGITFSGTATLYPDNPYNFDVFPASNATDTSKEIFLGFGCSYEDYPTYSVSFPFGGMYFCPGATKTWFDFYTLGFTYKITDIKIGNF